jgi:lysophospholipase L1-like esterase
MPHRHAGPWPPQYPHVTKGKAECGEMCVMSGALKSRRTRRHAVRHALAAGGLTVGALLSAHAQSVATAPARRTVPATLDSRWQAALDAFAAADHAQAPGSGGLLFVGSSSIRLWADLEKSFESQPVVIKRGFGGSRLSDCAHHLDRLVLPYKPRLVVVYAGDNDLADGATPQQVLHSFTAFVQGVRAALPQTRIAFLSIKPSPLRAALMPAAQQANALIKAYSEREPNLDYIDVYSKMLGPDGQPRAELFGPDALHLSEKGYALWRAEIAAHLAR